VRSHLTGAREDPQQFLGLGRSRHVKILCGTPQQQVSNATAGEKRHMAGFAQAPDDGDRQVLCVQTGRAIISHASMLI